MKITKDNSKETSLTLTIVGDSSELSNFKQTVLQKIAPKIKIAGFRQGKVPLELVEKSYDSNQLQAEVIDFAINNLYFKAIDSEKVKAIGQPKIELTKFVPYSSLEFKAVVPILGKVELADYKDIKATMQQVKVEQKDIDEVLERIRTQMAEYKLVDRVAKIGDRAWIDFEGKDQKGLPVGGAKGSDYPLALGSDTFIPGFEKNIVGLKAGQDKTFDLTFPKNYGVSALQGKKVNFSVKLKKTEETIKPELNDDFAKKVGPYKDMLELKADIKKELISERQNQATHQFQEDIVKQLVQKSKVKIPDEMINEQIDILDKDFRQNLIYRGMTFDEYLQNSSQTEDQYRLKELKPIAEERAKAGIVLGEVAEKENITLTAEELDIRIQVMKGQHSDPKLQAEYDSPSRRNDVAAKLLTEKTINKIVSKVK